MAFPTAALNSACIAAFGETVAYQRSTGVPFNVTAIREDAALLVDSNPGEYIALWVDLGAWTGAAPAKGDTITIGADAWKLFEVRADYGLGARLIFARTINA